MILRTLKPKYQEKAVQWLQAAALFALCIGILLPKIFAENFALSLLSGVMLGFSIAGNLFCLYYLRSKKSTPKEGK